MPRYEDALVGSVKIIFPMLARSPEGLKCYLGYSNALLDPTHSSGSPGFLVSPPIPEEEFWKLEQPLKILLDSLPSGGRPVPGKGKKKKRGAGGWMVDGEWWIYGESHSLHTVSSHKLGTLDVHTLPRLRRQSAFSGRAL